MNGNRFRLSIIIASKMVHNLCVSPNGIVTSFAHLYAKIPISGHDQLSQICNSSFLIIHSEGLKPTLSALIGFYNFRNPPFRFIGNNQMVVSPPHFPTENTPYSLNKSIKINPNPLQNTS